MSLSLNAWKGLSMVVFTLLAVVGAAASVVLKERCNQLYVSCGVFFSVGVLVAGGFVHLLTDCNEMFQELGVDFQWGSTIAGGTVVLLSCVEMSMNRYLQSSNRAARDGDATNNSGNKIEATVDETIQSNSLSVSLLPTTEDNSVMAGAYDLVVDESSPFSAALLSIALSIHSILEGMGIGSAMSVSELQSAFIAVAFHKGFTAFALGNGLIESGYWCKPKRRYFYLSIFSFVFVADLGIAIGWAIASSGSEMATAILTAITAGSFIYAALLEVLPEQTKIAEREHLWVEPLIFFFFTGYALMSLLAVWA
ncbi:hypothetical protein THAOC_30311 [Thalassiosira oceanica]|uniref:Zinc/iron permease n=1 Tax=Thalassiosira oceanica TaxID=159749 RepID=K0RBT0_THAOC|nr:hypothetical protein THAOC_30311 [Thalassiosira oceanica]|eukprot:EJK50650.1 hypothetical protein THAOC_30311 [Thalassiosira oceanica]